jgi:hypothetical protein
VILANRICQISNKHLTHGRLAGYAAADVDIAQAPAKGVTSIEDAVAQTDALDSIISANIHAVVEDSELQELSLQRDGEERDAYAVLYKLCMHKAA